MKIIYVNCSFGVSAQGLIAALADIDGCRHAIEKAVRHYTAGSVHIEYKRADICGVKATAATLKVSSKTREEAGLILAESAQKWEVRGGIWSKAALAAKKFKNIADDQNRFSSGSELLYFTGTSAGFFAALDALGVSEIYATPIPISKNKMNAAEESLFLNCCLGAAVEIKTDKTHIEAAGAALLAAAADFSAIPPFSVEIAGCGALTEEENSGLLMAVLGKKLAPEEKEEVYVIETSIDDMNPEFFPYAAEEIFKAGALDVFLTPIYMKKGRPGVLLTVLCREKQKNEVIKSIFSQTTTLGVRITRQERHVLQRKWLEVETPYGKIRVKLGYLKEGEPIIQASPEYEDCRRAALQYGVPVREVYREALVCAKQLMDADT